MFPQVVTKSVNLRGHQVPKEVVLEQKKSTAYLILAKLKSWWIGNWNAKKSNLDLGHAQKWPKLRLIYLDVSICLE